MQGKPETDGEAGFTLVELLVSLAVLGLTSGLLVSALGGAWFARPAAGGPPPIDEVAAAQRILRDRIEGMAPVVRDDTSAQAVDAGGDGHVFSFTARPLARTGPGPLQRYRLMLTPGGELILYTASGLDQAIDLKSHALTGWQPVRLLEGVTRLDISYFGPNSLGTTEGWQSFWLDRPQPPALVRISLTFARGDRRHWPELIVRPRADTNTLCRISAATGRCNAA